MTPLRIFIGYDARETIAYHVLSHSILSRATGPVSITPIVKSHFEGIYNRERGKLESTDFSLTRFLVPYLCDYQGYAIFMDCDMLCLTDIMTIMDEINKDPHRALYVCQHNYDPKTETKFLNQPQTKYHRKNWSSFMVFNMQHMACQRLTSEVVNTASGLYLHQFKWLDDNEIGVLPLEWNWLVGEYERIPNPKIVHYTLGGPWFNELTACDYSREWRDELDSMWSVNDCE